MQVERRRDRTVDELADEWDREAPAFEEGLRLFGYEVGSHYVGDQLQHASDVRHALGLAAIDHGVALVAALDHYLDVMHNALVASKAGAVATLTAEPYELFRALGGRRSEAQVRALDWTGDVDAVVACVPAYAFASNDLIGEAA